VDGKRVHTAGQFRGKQLIDHAVTLNAGLSLERVRHDMDSIMRLPARSMSGMAFMLMGFINNLEALRRESLGQLFCDVIYGSHIARLGERGLPVNGHKQVLKASPAKAHNVRS
jgi:hypothetical protein